MLSVAKSYSERLFSYHLIGELDDDAAREALTSPADQEGVTWDPAAVALVVAETAGPPTSCRSTARPPGTRPNRTACASMTPGSARPSDRRTSTAAFNAPGGSGQHPNSAPNCKRWPRTVPDQTRPPPWQDDSTRPTALGPARDALIKKALIYAPEHGQIGFTVPRMAEFITRQL